MKKEWVEFIRKAKQNSYASDSVLPKKTDDGAKRYRIEEGDMIYTDTYFGNLVDCGQERFYVDGKVVWIMSYRGGIFEEFDHLNKEAFNFLKKCISESPKNFPVRGPERIEEGNWVYENKWEGDFNGFVGEESIYHKGKKFCFRNYLGGIIRNR